MPIYSYVCKDCGHKFDLLVGVTKDKVDLKCEKCGSENIEKRFSAFSVGSSESNLSSGPSCSTGTCPTCFS